MRDTDNAEADSDDDKYWRHSNSVCSSVCPSHSGTIFYRNNL